MQKYMSKNGPTHLLDRYEKRVNPWKTKGRFDNVQSASLQTVCSVVIMTLYILILKDMCIKQKEGAKISVY